MLAGKTSSLHFVVSCVLKGYLLPSIFATVYKQIALFSLVMGCFCCCCCFVWSTAHCSNSDPFILSTWWLESVGNVEKKKTCDVSHVTYDVIV